MPTPADLIFVLVTIAVAFAAHRGNTLGDALGSLWSPKRTAEPPKPQPSDIQPAEPTDSRDGGVS